MTALTTPNETPPYFGCESSWWRDPATLAEAWTKRLTPEAMAEVGITSTWVLPALEHVAVEPSEDQ